MRDYPPPADYEKMLSSPQGIRVAFKDKALQAVEIEKTAIGLPRARAGAFAVVYRAILPDRSSSAVRLFLKDGDDRQDRYQLVSDHLGRSRVSCLVPFTYADNAFRAADGSWYPMMTMEWVKGLTLFDWLQARVTAGDQKPIRAVADKWRTVVKELHAAQIAHGDLQHANVMVTDGGDLKLVDYDGMCVPKLVGRKNLEIGVCPYQHPGRDGNTQLSLSLDNFSALFIYVGLRALAAEPKLWHDFVVQADYDKMLFRKEDIDDPANSAIFQRLRRSPDGDVQRLATSLTELARVPLDKVPFLEELLFSWDHVRHTISAAEFRKAVEVLTRNKKQLSDAPADLQQSLREAQQRVAALDDLIKAVQAGDEARMADALASPLFKGFPEAAGALAVARDAPAVLAAIQQLDVARRARRWRELVRVWDASKDLFSRPGGTLRRSVAALVGEVDSWRTRNALCDEIQAALRSDAPDGEALAASWKRLVGLGGHPECEGAESDVAKSASRGRAWDAFRRVPAGVSAKHDRALVGAWNDHEFRGWPTAERERPRAEQAVERLRAFKAVLEATEAPLTKAREESVLSLAGALPGSYATEVTVRVDTARRRLQALADLEAAIARDSDRGIAAAHQALVAAQAEALEDGSVAKRVAAAVERAKALESLKVVPASYPPEQAAQWDKKLLASWNDRLFAGCNDAKPWAAAAAAAAERRGLLARLADAVRSRDGFLAVDLDANPLVKGYAHTADVARFLANAIRDVGAVRGMVDALQRDDRATFARVFSSRVVREHVAAFRDHWRQIVEWVKSDVLPCDRLGLLPPVGQKPIEVRMRAGKGPIHVALRWKWPEARFTDECRVVLCRSRPATAASPDETPSLLRIPKTRELYQAAGGYHAQQIDPAWKGCYVVVWARLDLGETEAWSEPLVLGKV
jgi:hypothetical protein